MLTVSPDVVVVPVHLLKVSDSKVSSRMVVDAAAAKLTVEIRAAMVIRRTNVDAILVFFGFFWFIARHPNGKLYQVLLAFLFSEVC